MELKKLTLVEFTVLTSLLIFEAYEAMWRNQDLSASFCEFDDFLDGVSCGGGGRDHFPATVGSSCEGTLISEYMRG